MEVTARNHQKKISLNLPQIIKITTRVLKAQGIKRASLALVFVTSQKITAMNKKYLHQSCSTDVIAFDVADSHSKKDNFFTGDIVISTDAVIRNSCFFKTTRAYELVLYIVHGILHLLGFDDHRACDIKKMRAKEEKIMKFLGNIVNASIK